MMFLGRYQLLSFSVLGLLLTRQYKIRIARNFSDRLKLLYLIRRKVVYFEMSALLHVKVDIEH